MKSTSLMTRQIPVYLMLAMICVSAISGAIVAHAAISIASPRTVTTIGGEVFSITEELTVTPQGIGITTSTAAAAGTDESEVAMSASGTSANIALTQGNFEYRLKVAVATGGVSNAKEYTVELLAGGTSKGTVYVEQGATSVIADYVTIKWDLGTSLDDAVYEIKVLPQA